MASSQRLYEPLKLTTLFEFNQNVSTGVGVQSLRIPRGFPSSIIAKKLKLDFHAWTQQPNAHYSVDIMTSLPRGVVDGVSSGDQALPQIRQLYDLEHTKLVVPSQSAWIDNDTNAHHFVALTALPQRGVKLLARVNGRFTEKNEYHCETIDFDKLGRDNEDNTALAPPIVTVDNEFVLVIRLVSFDSGGLGYVRAVVGLEVS
ncbi:uncharacterized protein DFL_000467 [Arthrobotrys flagrans]|uniref:Uncharacterized protein n=1 Tax=Arthrobotrys flagrans TaxID=97331 RepID=A0A437AFB8_ARTFL|nr:hypothetical protein DFL_000467 [Arthrobotrys flagrans]